MLKSLTSLARREEGQTMAEYGIILALIAVIVAVTVGLLGGALDGVFNNVIGAL